ncbi:MAG: glycoside hydrolase family 20 zincin-like fold domain-containing protein [Chloroflexota bacterium]
MENEWMLLPLPRQAEQKEGTLRLADGKLIGLAGGTLFTARRLQAALREQVGLEWEIVGGTAVPQDQLGIILSVTPHSMPHEQGYQLTVTETAVHVVASSQAGLFYGVCTLVQLIELHGTALPQCRIVDWPDFPNRGVMLDISRDKVPTMETLYALIDKLASWKFNQVQLYTEHTFAYRQHAAIWAEASPMTAEEILVLDAYCRDRFIELVPNQNSFGHMHHWLNHPDYIHLAEAPDGSDTPWNFRYEGPFGLSPAVPETLPFLRGLYDELLPNFSSRQINIGADETWDLGQGKSKALVEEKGEGRAYLDFLLELYREVRSRERTMQFWGDIIVKYPDLVAELPRDVIALEWGYEADHPFDENSRVFAQSGIPFYVCPGTSSWNTVAGRTDNALGNLHNAASNGLKHGAIGFLMTDWGDRGHWQPLPVSYLGFGCGAALSWAYEANKEMDVAGTIGRFAFHDASGAMGQLAVALGNVHQQTEIKLHNGNIFFHILQLSPDKLTDLAIFDTKGELKAEQFEAALAEIDRVMAEFDDITLDRKDADLIKQEFGWAADMLRHGCQRALWMLAGADAPNAELAAAADNLLATYQAIWHARNRPGGFKDSVARLEKMQADYGDL